MLRIGICDDVLEARFALRCALERVLERQGEEAAFFEFSGGEGLLRWLDSHAGELDLVFLDLEMGELSGMETARRLRAADDGVQLVFMTGHAEGVFEGLSLIHIYRTCSICEKSSKNPREIASFCPEKSNQSGLLFQKIL